MSLLSPEHLERLTAQLARHEGTKRDAQGRHVPYRCSAGALTIGYGHNLDANPVPGIGPNSRLSEDQARRLLAIDIATVERALNRPEFDFIPGLDPVRYAALVNMAFNMGVGGLLTFRNTLRDIRDGRYADAKRRMLQSRWAQQVGRRARELARQMETGAWQ